MNKVLIIIGVVLFLAIIFLSLDSNNNTNSDPNPNIPNNQDQIDDDFSSPDADQPDGSDDPNVPTVNKVSLALLTDPDGEPERGCDDVVMIDRQIEPTTMPLTRSIELLFSIDDTNINGARHFIPNTADTLKFDRAEVINGVAKIYLTGRLSGLAGVCDNPRTAIQIEETALQFVTVDSVQLYLNGEPTDLIPSEN